MMMHHLGIFVALAIVLCSASFDKKDPDYIILSFIRSRCVANSNKGLDDYTTIQDSILLFHIHLMKYQRQLDQDAKVLFKLLCEDLQSTLYRDLVPLLEASQRCSIKEEAYIPDFISNFYNLTFKDHCKDGVKGIEEIKRLSSHLAKTNLQNDYADCLTKSTETENLGKPDFVLKKDILCGFFENVKKCASDVVKAKEDEDNNKSLELHFKPFKAVCD